MHCGETDCPNRLTEFAHSGQNFLSHSSLLIGCDPELVTVVVPVGGLLAVDVGGGLYVLPPDVVLPPVLLPETISFAIIVVARPIRKRVVSSFLVSLTHILFA